MTLATMIQEATDLLSLPRLSAVVGNTDPQAQTLLAIANEEGRKLAAAGNWQQLETQATFTTVDQQDVYPLDTVAPGWDRQQNPTFWDRSGQNLVNGPLYPHEYQANVAYISTQIYYQWRVSNDALVVYPPPSGGLEFAFEYITANWCRSAGGTGQRRWNADDDEGVLPEDLMVLGIEWRWNQRTGLTDLWPAQRDEYDTLVKTRINSGVQGRAIDITGNESNRQRRVPWGDWPDYP